MKQAVLLIMAVLAQPASAQESQGRFAIAPNGSGVGVWVVDTQSGTVKFCFPQSNSSASGGYVAVCTDAQQ